MEEEEAYSGVEMKAGSRCCSSLLRSIIDLHHVGRCRLRDGMPGGGKRQVAMRGTVRAAAPRSP